ncbi:MAG: hypothetical protein NT077_02105, partial [Candidatus Taylorbacteria bacterium]|nr:hypothetical protein [Candidatus Taylorbacteria bacterium]
SSSMTPAFKTAMMQKVGSDEIDACTPPAYDGLKIIAQVMQKAGVDSLAIKEGLYGINYTGGVSSDNIEFDQNGDLKMVNYTVKKIHNSVASPIIQ